MKKQDNETEQSIFKRKIQIVNNIFKKFSTSLSVKK